MHGKSIGFKGRYCIHPSQVAAVNRIYRPSEPEIENARNVVEAYEEGYKAGVGGGEHGRGDGRQAGVRPGHLPVSPAAVNRSQGRVGSRRTRRNVISGSPPLILREPQHERSNPLDSGPVATIKLSNPNRHAVITLGLGAAGGGVQALDFTALHDSSQWVYVLLTVVTSGALPVVGGWISPRLWHAVLFPVGMAVCLALVSAIGGPLSTDISAVGLVVILTIVYGGIGMVAFGVGWRVRWWLARARGSSSKAGRLGR